MEYLKKDTKFSQLANLVDESPGEKVHNLILYTRGHKSLSNFDIINESLI